jgi:hypothetical protein
MAEKEDYEYRPWHLKCPYCKKWIYMDEFDKHRQKEMEQATRVKDKLKLTEVKSGQKR